VANSFYEGSCLKLTRETESEVGVWNFPMDHGRSKLVQTFDIDEYGRRRR